MKNLTKKYKFVGDSSGWGWESNPVKGVVYDEGELEKMYGKKWKARGGIELIINWNTAEWDDTDTYWEEVTNEPISDDLITKLQNLDKLYSQMIGIVEELWVDLDEGSIEKCGDPELALELVMGIYKKHRRLVEVLDEG